MNYKEARKLAREIVSRAEATYGNAPYDDGEKAIDTIVASSDEWVELIGAQLLWYFQRAVLKPRRRRKDEDCK